jgi:hypothetical protein
MGFAVAIWYWPQDAALTEVRDVCGIFAIGLYHRAVLLNIHRPGVKGPERRTITKTERHGIRGQATESHL